MAGAWMESGDRDMKRKGQLHLGVAAAVGLALAFAGSAHAFDSRSDGGDGALDYTGTVSGTVVQFDPANPATLGAGFNPVMHPDGLDADGDNIYHFTSITIPDGVTIRLLANKMRAPGGVYWLSQGPIVINEKIDLSGENGHACADLPATSNPGPGGWAGGVGGRFNFATGLPGDGPGGSGAGFYSPDYSLSIHGVGGSHQTAGQEYSGVPRPVAGPTYGNAYLIPLVGGSGGGGGAGEEPFDGTGGGGGAGGGAIVLASTVSISFGTGSAVNANGGGGASGCSGGGNGGRGAGGAIHLLAPSITGPGALNARGNVSGTGLAGGNGWIRVDQFGNDLTVTANPAAYRGVPTFVVLPSAVTERALRVVSVGGVAVPENPTGSFTSLPDVEIATTDPVDFIVEGTDVPAGVRPTIYIANTEAQVQEVQAECLEATGVEGVTRSTTSVVIAPGGSQVFVRAVWDPDVTPTCN